MKKETKKATETAAKETDVITNDKTDAVVEAKPDATPKSKSLIIKLEDLEPAEETGASVAHKSKTRDE